MNITQEWIKKFNDYQSIYVDQPLEKYLFHACSLEALCGIFKSQYFFATNLASFNDPNEGKLSLSELLNIGLSLTKAQRDYIYEHINGDNLTNILDRFPTYVFCTSRQPNREFFFKEFHSNAIEKGADYQLELKTDNLRSNLWIETENGQELHNCLHFGKIIYDEKEQKRIMKEELSSFWKLILKDQNLLEEAKLDYLIRKCFFLGTFFKRPDDKAGVSEDEKEFRITINTLNKNGISGDISESLPKKDENSHAILHFTENFVSKITAKDRGAYDKMIDDMNIAGYVERHNIKVEILGNEN